MTAVFRLVLVLFVFVTVGYLLGRTKIVNTSHSGLLSNLLVYVFLPCCNLRAFASDFTAEYLTGSFGYLIFGIVMLAVFMILAHLIAKPFSKDKYDRYVYEYSMIVPSYGYIGYALAESLFGVDGLLNFIIFTIPFTVYIYTVAYPKLTKCGFSLKGLLNASAVSIAIGMVIGISGISLPGFAEDVIAKGNACMAPVSMLLTGIVISEFNLKDILKIRGIYGTVLIRLVVIPLAVGTILNLFGIRYDYTALAVLLAALPCGLNTVIFPKFANENCEIGAGLALVSTVCACGFIPAVFAVFGII